MLRADHAETSTERSSTKRQITDFLGHRFLALRNISSSIGIVIHEFFYL
jgi:hypothetical protein